MLAGQRGLPQALFAVPSRSVIKCSLVGAENFLYSGHANVLGLFRAQPEADRQGENHADMAVLEFSSGVTSSSPWILI
eukprot:scaffold210069_cov19-Tisochrysis_lutea.AAC.2